MTERQAKIRELTQAIKTAKRLGGSRPLRLERYREALQKVEDWTRKRKLAETKLKKYQHAVRRYQKALG